MFRTLFVLNVSDSYHISFIVVVYIPSKWSHSIDGQALAFQDERYWWKKSGNHQLISVQVGSLSMFIPLFTGLGIHPRWLALEFLNHQQNNYMLVMATIATVMSYDGDNFVATCPFHQKNGTQTRSGLPKPCKYTTDILIFCLKGANKPK